MCIHHASYIYIYIYTHMCMYVCVCIYLSLCVYIYIHTCCFATPSFSCVSLSLSLYKQTPDQPTMSANTGILFGQRKSWHYCRGGFLM